MKAERLADRAGDDMRAGCLASLDSNDMSDRHLASWDGDTMKA